MKLFLTLFITCLTTEAFSQLNDSDFKELQKKVVLTVNQLNAVQKELADVKMRKFEPTLRTMKLLYNKIENLNTIIANSKMKGAKLMKARKRLDELNSILIDSNNILNRKLEDLYRNNDELTRGKNQLADLSDELKKKLNIEQTLRKEQIDSIQNLKDTVTNLVEMYNKELEKQSSIKEELKEELSKIRIPSISDTLPNKSDQRGGDNFLVFADGGVLISEKGTLTGNISIGFSPGNFFIGFTGGVHSYYKNGFTAYPFGLSVKYSLSKAYKYEPNKTLVHPIIFVDAGYSYINEKYEIIDNFKKFGFYSNTGIQFLFSFSRAFNLTIGISYKNQGVKEFSKILVNYVTNTIDNINITAGILINL